LNKTKSTNIKKLNISNDINKPEKKLDISNDINKAEVNQPSNQFSISKIQNKLDATNCKERVNVSKLEIGNSFKINKIDSIDLVKNNSYDESGKKMKIGKNVSKGKIIKLSSNFIKNKKEDDRYRGLARDLCGNKSFDRVKIANSNKTAIGSQTNNNNYNEDSKIDINDAENSINKNKTNLLNNSFQKKPNSKSKNTEIDQNILNKLLKEADEDIKIRKSFGHNNSQLDDYNQEKKASIKNNEDVKNLELKLNSKSFKIDFNDENLLKISNIFAKKSNNNSKTLDENSNGKLAHLPNENTFVEGIYLLNQNGILKNKNDNLKIESGLNMVLEEDIKANNNNDKFVASDIGKMKDKIIYKDMEKDNENENNKKFKRNTVCVSNEKEMKNIKNNLNQNQKIINDDIVSKINKVKDTTQLNKQEISKINIITKEKNENKNVRNNSINKLNNSKNQDQNRNLKESRKSQIVNNPKILENFKIENEGKGKFDEKQYNQRRTLNPDIYDKKIEVKDDNNKNNNSTVNQHTKKLEFDNINKSSNDILKKEMNVYMVQKPQINSLLESKQDFTETEKDDDMMIIIENEQIIKDEIYIQKMTNYKDELLIKKSIQFNNEIQLKDLKMDCINNGKKTRQLLDKCLNDNVEKNPIENSNKVMINELIQNENVNLIEYENNSLNSNSQSNLGSRYNNNSKDPIGLMRNSLLDKKNSPLNNLQKNAFDSKDESPKNLNDSTKNQEFELSPKNNQSKITSKNIKSNSIKNEISSKNLNNKRLSAKNNPNINLKKILNNDNEIDLTDSLDTSFNKNNIIKNRNSVDNRMLTKNTSNKEVLKENKLKNSTIDTKKINVNNNITNNKSQKNSKIEIKRENDKQNKIEKINFDDPNSNNKINENDQQSVINLKEKENNSVGKNKNLEPFEREKNQEFEKNSTKIQKEHNTNSQEQDKINDEKKEMIEEKVFSDIEISGSKEYLNANYDSKKMNKESSKNLISNNTTNKDSNGSFYNIFF